MRRRYAWIPYLAAGSAVALLAATAALLIAQQPPSFFTTADADHDGNVTREEFRAATANWLREGEAAPLEFLIARLEEAFPEGALAPPASARPPQNRTPKPADVEKMLASLPESAPAKALKPRKVLVLSTCAGFVHSCIPLAARTVQELGARTGAWTATITYDAADINAANLQQYDLLFLNNTTGFFLDDADPAVTVARKKALLDFVRSGKGLAGIHAASDSYHVNGPGAPGVGARIGPVILVAADMDRDGKLTQPELALFSDAMFDRMDTQHAGRVTNAELRQRLVGVLMNAAPTPRLANTGVGRKGRDFQTAAWPEFNQMIGGFFKYHWNDPQHIVYRIDDAASPLTAMFRGGPFEVDDETYTFGVNTWSRRNLHVLTSVDYSKMSEADRLKEDYPREDHDYGLSWIRREGKGRVFYSAHGHNERVYAIRPMLEHLTAGIQYALGDLKADDRPSVK